MEQRIKELYEEIYSMEIGFWYYQSTKNLDEIKECISKVQEFVIWFMQENIFDIEEELYLGMKEHLVGILQDILEAMEQNDHVLLHDAVAYGLMEYLKLFIPEEEQHEE